MGSLGRTLWSWGSLEFAWFIPARLGVVGFIRVGVVFYRAGLDVFGIFRVRVRVVRFIRVRMVSLGLA